MHDKTEEKKLKKKRPRIQNQVNKNIKVKDNENNGKTMNDK